MFVVSERRGGFLMDYEFLPQVDLDNAASQLDQFNKDMFAEIGNSPFFCDTNCTQDPENVCHEFIHK
jgi:hypothetical protein